MNLASAPQSSTKPQFVVRSPETEAEWQAYYALRFAVLRAPWNQPLGTERDHQEDISLHAAALDSQGRIASVGRIQEVASGEAQIRFMATDPAYQGQGAGAAVVTWLEDQARQRGWRTIFLNARENALGFYRKLGYESVAEGPLLWGLIRHEVMRKVL